jgi:hypothetical protein
LAKHHCLLTDSEFTPFTNPLIMRQKIVIVLLLLLGLIVFYERFDWFFGQTPVEQIQSAEQIRHAYENRISNLQMEGSGTVKAILKDDTKGSRHQRFILDLSTGQTILIAHNIDLAPRIDNLRTGDPVDFFGEYEWNDKGGVIHWTHHDPNKNHVDGWLRHNGRMYR